MEKLRRPVDLPLLKIRLPIGGIISIIHRITGVLLVLLLPVATFWWDRSLSSEQDFNQVKAIFDQLGMKFLALVFVAIFIQHLVSGIRHLLLDLHIGISRIIARRSAWIVVAVSAVSILVVALGML